MRSLWRFFDRLEDRVRGLLAHYPVVYGLLAGIGVVLFWRGVWHTTDEISQIIWNGKDWHTTVDIYSSFWDGPISLAIGSFILLVTGVFVSQFIGKEIIISGLRGEKRLTEKTEVEVRTETGAIGQIQHDLRMLLRRMAALEKKMESSGVTIAPPKPPAKADGDVKAKK